MANGCDTQTIEARERRTVYTNALNKSLEIFVSYTEKAIDDVMSNGLWPVADAASLDRIAVFRILEKKSKTFGEIYRWDRASGGTTPLDPALRVLPATTAVMRWIAIMSDDTCISLKRGEFMEDEAALLSPRGVQSILIVPVFTEREFWGVVTFHDNTNERDFDGDCTSLLRSAARLCASTLIREEKTRRVDQAMETLERRKELTDILNKTAVFFLSQSGMPFADMMTAGIKQIVDLIDIDRFSVFRNSMMPDGLHASQIYRWDKLSGGTTQPNSAYINIPFAQYAPNWEYLFAEDKAVNGPVRTMPEREAATLKAIGAVSAFVTPVFINNDFWGFSLFEDHHNERYFEDDHAEMIRSASFLITNAFIHDEMERRIADGNELNRAMFEASPIGLTTYNDDMQIVDCNEAILSMYGVEKQYYLDNFIKFSPEYQGDGQKTTDKLADITKRALDGEVLKLEWLHNTLEGELIPCDLLLTRVKYKDKYIGLGYVYDLRSIKKMEKNIQWLKTEADKIYYDPLTGIYNRRYFDEGLKRVIKSLSRSGGVLSVMMIDIDFFKNYNDTYGHSEGDTCLKTVAKIISQCITRADDFVARYGGEEFVIVLPNTVEDGIGMIAEKLLENMREARIPHENSAAAKYVTFSIGATSGMVEHAQNGEAYIQRADEAMYKSKQNGRDRYTFERM